MTDNVSRIKDFLSILDTDASQIYTGVMINCSKDEIGLYTSFNKRQIDYAYIHKYKIPLVGNSIWAKPKGGGWWCIFAVNNDSITTDMTLSLFKNMLNVISLTCNGMVSENFNSNLYDTTKEIYALAEDSFIGSDTIIVDPTIKRCVKGMLFEYDPESSTLS